MDTAFAAILGCMEESRSALFVNVGNSHTLAALIREKKILGLLEHHTSCLTTDKLDNLLMRFQKGDISSREVLDDGGHGAVVLPDYRVGSCEEIVVTGPNRGLLEKSSLNVRFAAPYGNMMLTGPFGLVKGAFLKAEIIKPHEDDNIFYPPLCKDRGFQSKKVHVYSSNSFLTGRSQIS